MRSVASASAVAASTRCWVLAMSSSPAASMTSKAWAGDPSSSESLMRSLPRAIDAGVFWR